MLLNQVGIVNPESRWEHYPHQFSGGMRQRIMIAIALASHPKLLIADEPTTALDVTIQAQVLTLIKSLQEKNKMSLLLITHDLGIVAQTADKVAVMYAGEIVEFGTATDIFENPQHPYTWGLLQSLPTENTKHKTPLKSILGQPPQLLNPPEGCSFTPRCDYAMSICQKHSPSTNDITTDHRVSCW